MKFLIFTILFITAYVGALIENDNIKGSGETHELNYIGSADGKAYFYDLSYRTWFDAGKLCQSANMELAVITTENQIQMLVSTWFPPTYYWTAGRDAFEIRQFSWNHTNSAVPEFLNKDGPMYIINGATNYVNCLSIIRGTDRLHPAVWRCENLVNTLCST